MFAIGYVEWRKFEGAIQRAKDSCENSGQKVDDHFGGAAKMVVVGSGAERELVDYHLSRYACYLIAQNGDPRKKEIALAQTYFAIQTRKQELHEQLFEDSKRVFLRDEMKEHNKNLARVAKEAGVVHHAQFQDFGYMGLYGGLRQRDIHHEVGQKVRKTISELGGTMPEKLPTAQHVKESKKRLKLAE